MNVTFKDLVDFYRHPSFEFDSSDSSVARFVPQNADDIVTLNKLLEGYEDTGLTIDDSMRPFVPHKEVVFNQVLPRTGLGRLFNDFSDLVAKFPKTEPKNYYIKSLDFYSADERIPESIQRYKKYVGFISFLKSISTYYDESVDKIIFVSEGTAYKVDTKKPQLSVAELDQLDFASMSLIQEALINEDTYKDNRRKIFIEALGGVIAEDHGKNDNINFFIQNIKTIAQEFEKRLKVFLSNFSYDKILNQLKTMQVEETGKIHKVFSDIQNQALALPIASLLAISQMKSRNDSMGLITNSFIIAGVIIFISIVWLLLRNQRLTLKTITTELESRKKRILHDPKYAAVFDGDKEISEIFKDLDTRKTNQCIILWSLHAISLLCLIASSIYFLYLNFPETWQMLLEYLSSLFTITQPIEIINEQQ